MLSCDKGISQLLTDLDLLKIYVIMCMPEFIHIRKTAERWEIGHFLRKSLYYWLGVVPSK